MSELDVIERFATLVAEVDATRPAFLRALAELRASSSCGLNEALRVGRRSRMTLRELAEATGLTQEGVRQKVEQVEEGPAPRTLSNVEAAGIRRLHDCADGRNPGLAGATGEYRRELKRLHDEGVSKSQLARTLGLTPAAVFHQIRRLQGVSGV